MSGDGDLREARDQVVCFRCLTCGATSERPAAYMARTYRAATLADIQARARCLRYIGGERCGGRAAVTLGPRLAAPLPGYANARRVGDLDDTFPPELQ